MVHIVDPRQIRPIDPFEGIIPPAGYRLICSGWQGVFRHALLEVMPVDELAKNFSQSLGAPTKGTVLDGRADLPGRLPQLDRGRRPPRSTSSAPTSNTH